MSLSPGKYIFLSLFFFSLSSFAKDTNHYAVLGVDKDTPEAKIKSTYRTLAVRYHPDKNPGDAVAEEKFKEVGAAWEVLGDATFKKYYDDFYAQHGRYPTTEEFDPITFFRAQRAAEHAAETAPKPAYTHVPNEVKDPKVENFIMMSAKAQESYVPLKAEKFWESFSKNHGLVEKSYLDILNDASIPVGEKHRAFNAYIDSYLYQTLIVRRGELQATQLLQALNMVNTAKESVREKLGADYVDSQKSYARAILVETLNAQDKKLVPELAALFKKAQKGGVVGWISRWRSPAPVNKEMMLELMSENPRLAGELIEHYIANEDVKPAEAILDRAISDLNNIKARIQNHALNESEMEDTSKKLEIVERVIADGKKLPKLLQKAHGFFKGTVYADLKQHIGESVPLRSDQVIELQIFLQLGLDRLNELDPKKYNHKKEGVVPFISKAVEKYQSIMNDPKMDVHDRAQALTLFVQTLRLSLQVTAQRAPFDMALDIGKQLNAVLQNARLLNAAGTTPANFIARIFATQRVPDTADGLKSYLVSKKESERKMGLEYLKELRIHNAGLDGYMFNEIPLIDGTVETYKSLFALWGQDVAQGPSHFFYDQSRSLLMRAMELRKEHDQIGHEARKALIGAQQSLSAVDAQHAKAVKDEAIKTMKAAGFSCLSRLRTKGKMN